MNDPDSISDMTHGHPAPVLPVAESGFWVFAYGSLMWDPGFPFAESRTGRLYGYHRALCIWSVLYRGTEEKPGLVLGLAPGGSCRGIVYRVRDGKTEPTLDYLYQREMVTRAYQPRTVPVHLEDGRRVKALTFVSDKNHPQYACGLSRQEITRIVRQATGGTGSNTDYILNTVESLGRIGLRDTPLQKVAAQLETEPIQPTDKL